MAKKKMRGVPQLGGRIKRFMAAVNLDASELSARTGISTSYLSRILNGEVVNPTIDFVSRIAAGLGVTVNQLLNDEGATGFTPAVAEAFGAGVGLGAILPRTRTDQQQTEIALQQHSQNIGLLVNQAVAKAQLTPQQRTLAAHLILENARVVCEVLATKQDQQSE